MKITTANKLFGPELAPILTAGCSRSEIKRKTVVNNLLAVPKAARMLRIDQFLDRLQTCDDEKHRTRFFKRFLERVSSEDLSPQSQKTCGLFQKGMLFPNELFPVSQFRARAENSALMEELMDRIDSSTDSVQNNTPHTHADDKKNAARRPRKKSYPYDFNRTGKELSVYLNASDVVLSDGQEYILGSCPYNLSYMNDLFNALVTRCTRVLVSLHQEDETAIESVFWKNSTLSKLALHHGWKVSHDQSKDTVCYQADTKDAKIVERTLSLTNGVETRSITLLHYVGWKDSRPAPCEKTLIRLIQRIDEIGGKIWINCKGGNGRTGELAAIHWGKQKIDQALKAGKKSAQIALNVPEMIGELRSQRRRTVSHTPQLAQIYSTLGKYITKV